MSFDSIPAGLSAAPMFPGRIIKVGDTDPGTVKLIQKRLNELGCGPLKVNGVFDKDNTERAVKLFQARFPDVTGSPLVTDGKIGSLTWGALFGADTIQHSVMPDSELVRAAIAVAKNQIGVVENPLGSNRGPEVDKYLRTVGLDPKKDSFPWCVAFTFYCYQQAALQLEADNPHVKTAGVLDHWNKAKGRTGALRITHAQAIANPILVTPGALFIMDFGSGNGHTGIVLEVANGRMVTCEGNTSNNGSREGIGVFRRDSRKITDINKGFIDYSAA